jgi:Concanavalin A-like lectin/glucanases superfamily
LIKCFLQVIAAMLYRFSFVVALLTTAALAASPALAASGPVGIWKLDEGSGTTVSDSSGNGNNGVISGNVSWVPGVSDSNGLGFSGAGEVKVNDNNALEPASAVTVSAWFRNDGSPGAFRYIVAKGANGCVAASYGLYTGPNGGLQFYVSKGRGSTFARSPDAGPTVWDSQWHLAVGTYDGSTIRLYIDGHQVGSGTTWNGSLEYLLPSSNDFYIGNYPGCSDHNFIGDIDDVMVWGRALGVSDIQALLTGGGPITPTQPDPPSGGGSGNGGGGGGGTGTGSGGGGSGPSKSDSAPAVSGVKLSTNTITVNANNQVVAGGGSHRLSITYTASQAATLKVTLLRSEKGVRRGKQCVTPSGHGRRRRCTHFVVISSVMHTDRAGRLTLGLNQLLHRRLRPGTYRLDVTPRAHGKVGKTVRLRFVVRRSRRHH